MVNPEDLTYIHPQLRSLATPVAGLTPDPKNARRHNRRNLDTIKASLERFGMRQALVVQRRGETLVVRAGNGRLEVAKELGWEYLPVLVFEEDDDDAVAYAIRDNRTAELAEWDFSVLGESLSELGESEFDTNDLGWSDLERDALESVLEAPDPPKKDKKKREREKADKPETLTVVQIANVPTVMRDEVVAAVNAALEVVDGVPAQSRAK